MDSNAEAWITLIITHQSSFERPIDPYNRVWSQKCPEPEVCGSQKCHLRFSSATLADDQLRDPGICTFSVTHHCKPPWLPLQEIRLNNGWRLFRHVTSLRVPYSSISKSFFPCRRPCNAHRGIGPRQASVIGRERKNFVRELKSKKKEEIQAKCAHGGSNRCGGASYSPSLSRRERAYCG